MTRSIMVTADLAREYGAGSAFRMAAALANEFGARLTVVGVTMSAPTSVAKTPEAYSERLEAYARAHGEPLGLMPETLTIVSNDPAADLDDKLQQAVRDTDADLVVMATHMPGLADDIFAGHATHMASHAPCSVMVVR